MRGLSLTQPWADVILEQGKRIENRTAWTACNYRGPILLHAAKGLGSRSDVFGVLSMLHKVGVPDAWVEERFEVKARDGRGMMPVSTWYKPRAALRLGGIVGRAEIVDVIKPGKGDAAADMGEQAFSEWVNIGMSSLSTEERRAQRKWWFGGFALVLDKVEPLPFVPWAGALGLFEVPDDYATRAAQVEASGG